MGLDSLLQESFRGTINMEEPIDKALDEVFDSALALHQEITEGTEDTASKALQDKVKKAILMLEDATRLVSLLDIFSRNEHHKELPGEHLKYFLLPVLLGDRHLCEGGEGECDLRQAGPRQDERGEERQDGQVQGDQAAEGGPQAVAGVLDQGQR